MPMTLMIFPPSKVTSHDPEGVRGAAKFQFHINIYYLQILYLIIKY
jgi:hypothetical protein